MYISITLTDTYEADILGFNYSQEPRGKMSAQKLRSPGRFARLLNDERFVDVTVLLCSPGTCRELQASLEGYMHMHMSGLHPGRHTHSLPQHCFQETPAIVSGGGCRVHGVLQVTTGCPECKAGLPGKRK
jgi:hypothetical protein